MPRSASGSDFEHKLSAAASAVEGRLEAVLAARASGSPDRLAAAMRHAVLGGGKRFRPFLVLETAALFEAPDAAALQVAAALECVHCYSLVHDDLPAMDNDELRRGRPTVWKAFDDWTAILAGDALLTLAFELLAEADDKLAPEAVIDLTRRLALASGPRGMVGGQAHDLAADKLDVPARPTIAHIEQLQAMKTGALILFACEAGGLIGGASQSEMAALGAFGRALGRAFQLSDDLLDVRGEAATVGKAVGKDDAAGKATLVSLLGLPEAERRLDQMVADAVDALAAFGHRADALREAARFMGTRDR